MPRVKLAVTVLVALLGISTLSGCQNDPTMAVTLGDLRLTNADVDAAAAQVEKDVAAAGSKVPAEQYGSLRQAIVTFTVFNELSRRYAKDNGITVPAPDYAATAQTEQLPETDPYVRLLAQANGYHSALMAAAKPVTPSEADIRAAFDRYVQQNGGTVDYATARAQFASDQDLQTAIGLRNGLIAVGEKYGLSVNPRYTPLEVSLSPLVTLPLSAADSNAVRDAA